MQIVVNNIITNYNLFETENSKEYLVILPGWKNETDSWNDIAKELSEKYKVIVLDFPGFGSTPILEKNWDTYSYAKFTEDFLQKLGINELILIGHSFGGRVAIILGSQENADIKIKKLILVDSAGLNQKSLKVKIKTALAKTYRPLKDLLPINLIQKINKLLGSEDYNNAGEMREVFVKIVNQDLGHLLPKVKIPTLILWGDKDKQLSVSETKIFHKLIPNSLVRIVWGAGHHPHIEKPKVFLDIVKSWI